MTVPSILCLELEICCMDSTSYTTLTSEDDDSLGVVDVGLDDDVDTVGDFLRREREGSHHISDSDSHHGRYKGTIVK